MAVKSNASKPDKYAALLLTRLVYAVFHWVLLPPDAVMVSLALILPVTVKPLLFTLMRSVPAIEIAMLLAAGLNRPELVS